MSVKISVIIPVYNTAKYLDKCLDSVVGQTLKEIEIICVDDGSDDDSLKIIDRFAQSDKRIVVVQQDHKGVSSARNRAIDLAKGEFLAFIDSDDWYYDDDVLGKLYRAAKSNNVKIAGGSMSEYDSSTGELIVDYVGRGHLEGYQFTKSGLVKYSDWQNDFGFARFIYDRQMIVDNEIYFPILTRHEDPVFLVKAMICAGEFYALKDIVYTYRIRYKEMNLSSKNIDDAIYGIVINYQIAIDRGYEKLKEWCVESLLWMAEFTPAVQQIKSDKHQLELEAEALRSANNDLSEKNRELADALASTRSSVNGAKDAVRDITSSRAYRVGLLVTLPARSLKRALTGKRKK